MADPHPEDDPSILDEEDLWRRISPTWVLKDKDGRPRVTSQAFQNDDEDGTMSIHLSSVAEQIGRTPSTILERYPGYSMASITAGDARQQKQGVKPDPSLEDPDHGSVVGDKGKGVRKQLRKAAKWVVEPQ